MGVYTTKEKVIVEDIGKDFKMNNRSFLRILQEAANRASTDVGYGIADIEKNKTSWVLLYWRIKILKRARYNDELTIQTWASFTKNIYSIRSFKVYLGDELIAIADSKWVFVDAYKHSILKIPDDIMKTYGKIEDRVFKKDKAVFLQSIDTYKVNDNIVSAKIITKIKDLKKDEYNTEITTFNCNLIESKEISLDELFKQEYQEKIADAYSEKYFLTQNAIVFLKR